MTATTTAPATTADQWAIVVNGAAHGVPVPSNSSLIVVGPCADHNELRELLYRWFDRAEATGRPVPYYIRKVADAAPDLERTADNAVIYESEGTVMAAYTRDAGYAAHPYALFGTVPDSINRELIATMYKSGPREGFPRGAWVIEREPDGLELAVIGDRRKALARFREIVADHFAPVPA